ncbi:hypothetical protein Awo_c01400 [Acetobacterium woodii DSM 1030]|uniref:Uncharacterized protein n=1 Tax=Acetobacterium woodii (strain ATCC 29683 / DSM 1030 / JCM 2381 / KCTC 1655 / WB1) TaxID=931626 RepID=H6LF43_ACEWD|nr:hypothetical protein Awo_c01400 [Acetobacterium woodii DSM 1030]
MYHEFIILFFSSILNNDINHTMIFIYIILFRYVILLKINSTQEKHYSSKKYLMFKFILKIFRNTSQLSLLMPFARTCTDYLRWPVSENAMTGLFCHDIQFLQPLILSSFRNLLQRPCPLHKASKILELGRTS